MQTGRPLRRNWLGHPSGFSSIRVNPSHRLYHAAMRAFFAIPVPLTVAERLLKLLPPVRTLRRVRAVGMHLTLHFLPEAPPTLADDLGPFPLPGTFRLMPGRLLLLPESGPVRVIAASLTPSSGLTSLHSAIGTELHRLGLPIESRAFLPHLTLARADPPLPQQVRAQTPISPREDLSFPVEQLELIESRPAERAGGFEYHTLRTWGLPR